MSSALTKLNSCTGDWRLQVVPQVIIFSLDDVQVCLAGRQNCVFFVQPISCFSVFSLAPDEFLI